MSILIERGIEQIFHVIPLHYLPFIVRSKSLKPKPYLINEGFTTSHFRSKSKHLDEQRGFGDYLHLSSISEPPILEAKLGAGFPHLSLSISVKYLKNIKFDLCRYNIAMTRKLRRGDSAGFNESPENGYYFGDMQIPIARSDQQKSDLILSNPNRMLELLSKDLVPLGESTSLHVFNSDDRKTVDEVLQKLGCNWTVQVNNALNYTARDQYRDSCNNFIKTCLNNPDWKGNGLEFDKV